MLDGYLAAAADHGQVVLLGSAFRRPWARTLPDRSADRIVQANVLWRLLQIDAANSLLFLGRHETLQRPATGLPTVS